MNRYSLLGDFIILLTLFDNIVCPNPITNNDYKLVAHYSLSLVQGAAKYRVVSASDEFIFNHRRSSSAFKVKFSDIRFDEIQTIDPQTVKFSVLGSAEKSYHVKFAQAAQADHFVKNRVIARDTEFIWGVEILTSKRSPIIYCFEAQNGNTTFHLVDCNVGCVLDFTFERSHIQILSDDGLKVTFRDLRSSNDFQLHFKFEKAKTDFLSFFR